MIPPMSDMLYNKMKKLQAVPGYLFAPLPLLCVQPALDRIVRHVARTHPELFERLGDNADKTYLIDPVNLPFAMVLRPNPDTPGLTACRRRNAPVCDTTIRGSLLRLMALLDSAEDSDAMFFSRSIKVEGDTEAIVALRNALDDMDESLLDISVEAFALLRAPARLTLHALRKMETRIHA